MLRTANPIPKILSSLTHVFIVLLCCASAAQAQNLPFNNNYSGAPAQDANDPLGHALRQIPALKPGNTVVDVAPPFNQGTTAQKQADKDLWARIRRGFAMPDLQDSYVDSQENWYSTRPEYIGRMTERSRKYLYHIVEELERRKMPTELALLPFIESAFNPQAHSSAKAAGIWQFMPSTGTYFSLKQTTFRDDRRDVQASTRAALDYLQKLHGMFGDWHLALAAYNWGEGSVMRAQKKNMNAGLPLAYTDLTMPAETRNYVPKLQAVKNIVANPERFGAQLPDIENHPYFKAVALDRDIDVNVAARLAGVDLDHFKSLNPSAKQSMIIASGTREILLPWDSADVFARNLQQYDGQLASYTAWVAPATMRVAEAARRTGMNETHLRTLNNIPRGMLIRGGSTLLVDRSLEKAESDISEKVADNAHIGLAPEVTMQRTYIRAGKGESVASLARRHGISPERLAGWNNTRTNKKLSKGQSMLVMVSTRFGEQPQAPGARRAAVEEASPSCKGKGKKRHCAAAADKESKVAKTAKSKSNKHADKKPAADTKASKKLAKSKSSPAAKASPKDKKLALGANKSTNKKR